MNDEQNDRPPRPLVGTPVPPGAEAERERERNRREIEQLQRFGAARGKMVTTLGDAHTCEACAAWAGVELELGDHQLELPHPRCTSPLGCRCRWVFVR